MASNIAHQTNFFTIKKPRIEGEFEYVIQYANNTSNTTFTKWGKYLWAL